MDGLVLKRPLLAKDLKTDRRICASTRVGAAGTAPAPLRGRGPRGRRRRMSRPRSVGIAMTFDDGTATSTLVNPQRDLADARTAYGISTSDILVAPTLAEAWSSPARS